MSKILVVEDDPQIRASLTGALTELGHDVDAVGDGTETIAAVVGRHPELVLLDLGLPDVEGSTLLSMIRSVSDAPVIVVTARSEPREIVRILDLGADDYVVKPFDVEQLDARIRAVVRRSARSLGLPRLTEPFVVGDLVLDGAGRTVTVHDRRVELREHEFDLLLILAAAEGQLVPAEALISRLWGDEVTPQDGTNRLDVLLSGLRRKLGETGSRPRHLHRIRGRGLRLAAAGGE